MGHGPQIALQPQTDERNFPRHDPRAPPGHSGHGYPKMLNKICTVEDRDAWLEKYKQIDQNTRQEFYIEKVPKVGSIIPMLATQELVDAGFANAVGDNIVAQTAEDEELIYDTLGMKAPLPAPRAAEVGIPLAGQRNQVDDDALDSVMQENELLKKRLAAFESGHGKVPAEQPRQKRKYTKRAKPSALAGASDSLQDEE